MPHVYKDARKLEKQEKIGDMECVTLIKTFTNLKNTATWKQGEPVVGNKNIAEGTAIGTMVNGKWPGYSSGNHSAFYLGQVSNGIYIIDQWPSVKKPKISKRFIYRKGKDANGNYIDPPQNADAFFVIE